MEDFSAEGPGAKAEPFAEIAGSLELVTQVAPMLVIFVRVQTSQGFRV
mgnify:CR=1 FL=1